MNRPDITIKLHKHDIDLAGEPLIHWGLRVGGLWIRLPGNRTLFLGTPNW